MTADENKSSNERVNVLVCVDIVFGSIKTTFNFASHGDFPALLLWVGWSELNHIVSMEVVFQGSGCTNVIETSALGSCLYPCEN